MDEIVAISELTKQFGKFTAVDKITLTVKKGEIFGFLGPNGAGKSTTIKMLCGILMPSNGSGCVSGYDILHEQDRIKNIIGYMSQRFSLYDDLTVIENLNFFGSIYNMDNTVLRNRIRTVLDMAGIGERKDDLVKNLPGGIKQRLALGCAILHDPQILFLDEPTSGVDPLMRRNFWDIIYQFSREGKTIFVTTHYMDEAEHCDRIALIIAGEIIAMNSPLELKQQLPYTVYSLQVDDFINVFNEIKLLENIQEAAIFGSEIHLISDRKISLKRDVGDFMKRHGITSFSIKCIEPSLEDVFVCKAREYHL